MECIHAILINHVLHCVRSSHIFGPLHGSLKGELSENYLSGNRLIRQEKRLLTETQKLKVQCAKVKGVFTVRENIVLTPEEQTIEIFLRAIPK